MGALRPRPAGADDFVKWRRSIDEHLELGLLTWDEYGMFNWLCTKADPRRGTLRTSWTVLAGQTRLGAKHVEKLCRGLKGKGYIDYPEHRGWRTLVHVGIDKFPLRDGTYTSLPRESGASPAELPAKVPGELQGQTPEESTASPAGRVRERSRSSLRVRSADASTDTGTTDPSKPEERLGRAEALAAAPRALRETVGDPGRILAKQFRRAHVRHAISAMLEVGAHSRDIDAPHRPGCESLHAEPPVSCIPRVPSWKVIYRKGLSSASMRLLTPGLSASPWHNPPLRLWNKGPG